MSFKKQNQWAVWDTANDGSRKSTERNDSLIELKIINTWPHDFPVANLS